MQHLSININKYIQIDYSEVKLSQNNSCLLTKLVFNNLIQCKTLKHIVSSVAQKKNVTNTVFTGAQRLRYIWGKQGLAILAMRGISAL